MKPQKLGTITDYMYLMIKEDEKQYRDRQNFRKKITAPILVLALLIVFGVTSALWIKILALLGACLVPLVLEKVFLR